MARPKKNTVDYFPHPVNNGSRMFVMEQKYGDKGYCCYYKLLEMLGKTENHYLDFSISKDKIFFSASLNCSNEQALEMITTLAELGSIDKQLWVEKSIVWCDEFISSISHVYNNRRVEMPKKPFSAIVSTDENPIDTVVSTSENTHSIVEYSKVNNNINGNLVSTSENPKDLRNSFFKTLNDLEMWVQAVCMSANIRTKKDFEFQLDKFLKEKIASAQITSESKIKDLKIFFVSWLKYNPLPKQDDLDSQEAKIEIPKNFFGK